LRDALLKRPQGETLVSLIEASNQSKPSKEAITALQKILIETAGAKISYPGSATGIDGKYGSRTHAALARTLRQELAALSLPNQAQAPKPALSSEQIKALLPSTQQSLKSLARLSRQLPDSLRAQIGATPEGSAFLETLAKGSDRPLNKSDLIAIQTYLVKQGAQLRYPGHATGLDGQYGKRTYLALRELLTQGPKQVSNAPQDPPAAHPTEAPTKPPASPSNPNAGPYPRYDRMLEDQLLDITMAIGYDEGAPGYASANLDAERRLSQDIESRGFKQDTARALELLKQAGREVNADYSAFYVKENISTANGKPVHSIIRVLKPGDGSKGAEMRKAALEGMKQSDVFMYGGHARYGTGPDFDRNLSVTIDWEGVANAKGVGKVTYEDEEILKKVLSAREDDSEAIAQLKALKAQGKLTVTGQNQGNIRIGVKDKHPYEMGSFLMQEALADTPSQSLSEEIQTENYRLWLFNGCRTHDYQAPIRQMGKDNKALNEANLDLVLTNQTLWWENTEPSLISFLDGVLALEDANALNNRLQASNPEQARSGKTHVRQGFDDNPLSQPLKP